jgi:outer membrane protein OmpA-like peptidoglycan-associated protein
MTYRLLPIAVAIATLAACASTPAPSSSLEQARQRVKAAQADTRVVSLAPAELKRAEEALRLTEKVWSEEATPAVVDHHAYMTGQRVTLAQETAASLADQATTASAAAERDRMRLAARTSEADAATRQLTEAQRANAQKTADLATAQSQAERDQALANQRIAAAQAQAQREQELASQRGARVNSLESQLAELNAKKTERGIVVTLGDVLFDSGRSELRAAGSRQMLKIADAFRQDPTRTATIEGHTDSVGSAETNRELSGQRASAVKSALVSLGVPSGQLTTESRGEDTPVSSNDSASGRQMNRRVEIIFAPGADR